MFCLELQNQYPDCVFLELRAIARSDRQYDLYLKMRFGEEHFNLLQGKIGFGLKGGTLR
jgi:hypothetical protein